MSAVTRLVVVAALALLAGCADKNPIFEDAGPRDAAVDAPTDAPVDAPPPLPAYELTGGAKGLRGSRYSADVQVGHGFGQQPVKDGAGQTRAEGNAAVKP